jgi:hypothetical protein
VTSKTRNIWIGVLVVIILLLGAGYAWVKSLDQSDVQNIVENEDVRGVLETIEEKAENSEAVENLADKAAEELTGEPSKPENLNEGCLEGGESKALVKIREMTDDIRTAETEEGFRTARIERGKILAGLSTACKEQPSIQALIIEDIKFSGTETK